LIVHSPSSRLIPFGTARDVVTFAIANLLNFFWMLSFSKVIVYTNFLESTSFALNTIKGLGVIVELSNGSIIIGFCGGSLIGFIFIFTTAELL